MQNAMSLNSKTSVINAHPVVREMFVDDFAHHCLLSVKHVGSEVQNDVEHARLRGECGASLLRQWICNDLIVQIIRSQSTKHHVDICAADCHATTSVSNVLHVHSSDIHQLTIT